MSTVKTKVDNDRVSEFLRKSFSESSSSLEPIKSGELSQGFFFISQGKDYVIRINKKLEGFRKDKYAHDNFHSKDIPIPRTIKLGKFNDTLHYSITERAPGKIIDDFKKTKILDFIPSIIKTLDAIHNTSIDAERFGDWNSKGVAKNNTWKEHLLELMDENDEDLKNKNHSGFLEEYVVKELTKIYSSLIVYCPEIRHLVHADFGFNNTLSDGEKITGVIDWENSKYGDFLFDIAWLNFWQKEINYKDIFLQHYKKNKVDINNFEERILCYTLYFGIGSLFFFAKSEQEGSYTFARDRLFELVK